MHRYGILDYGVALALQKEWLASILAHNGHKISGHEAGGHGFDRLSRANLLLLLEHPSVYTVGRSGIGRSGQWQDVFNTAVVSGDSSMRMANGLPGPTIPQQTIPIIKTDRGGKVTYHGPGQLVAYVVCDLRPHALAAVRQHVTRLEETAIQTLSAFGVFGQRDPQHPGIWVENAKIAALGVRIHHGIAYHGIAINRDPDLRFFKSIIPCGLVDRSVTSLTALGLEVSRVALEAQFLVAFRKVFNVHWQGQLS